MPPRCIVLPDSSAMMEIKAGLTVVHPEARGLWLWVFITDISMLQAMMAVMYIAMMVLHGPTADSLEIIHRPIHSLFIRAGYMWEHGQADVFIASKI